MATVLLGLAQVHHAQEQFADAEPLYVRALRIREQTLGPADVHVAEVLEGYAELLRTTGRVEQAAELAARARALRPEEYVPVPIL